MPRKLKRKTLARGIYFDGGTIELRATSNGRVFTDRLPGTTPLKQAIAERKRLVAKATTESPRTTAGTLEADTIRYLKLHTHLISYKSRKAILAAWNDRVGPTARHLITSQDVLAARVQWLADGLAPKTINHRVSTLHHLYKTLDGRKADTPCDDVKPLHVPKTPIQRVSDEQILAVDAELQRKEHEATGNRKFDGAKTRARFRVLASTGRRPSELMRAEPEDVNLEERVWVVRDGKGGWSPGLYLNDDMLAAWRLFIESEAWGTYSTSAFAKVLKRAGWPAGIRPYNARHTTWIRAIERKVSASIVQQGAGHKSIRTTRDNYTGVLNSEMQELGTALEGRFNGWPVVPPRGSDGK